MLIHTQHIFIICKIVPYSHRDKGDKGSQGDQENEGDEFDSDGTDSHRDKGDKGSQGDQENEGDEFNSDGTDSSRKEESDFKEFSKAWVDYHTGLQLERYI